MYINSKDKNSNLIIIIKLKDTDNIIGLKEEIAMRLEGVVGIERIDVREEGENGRTQDVCKNHNRQ
jgi:hypothetical protein